LFHASQGKKNREKKKRRKRSAEETNPVPGGGGGKRKEPSGTFILVYGREQKRKRGSPQQAVARTDNPNLTQPLLVKKGKRGKRKEGESVFLSNSELADARDEEVSAVIEATCKKRGSGERKGSFHMKPGNGGGEAGTRGIGILHFLKGKRKNGGVLEGGGVGGGWKRKACFGTYRERGGGGGSFLFRKRKSKKHFFHSRSGQPPPKKRRGEKRKRWEEGTEAFLEAPQGWGGKKKEGGGKGNEHCPLSRGGGRKSISLLQEKKRDPTEGERGVRCVSEKSFYSLNAKKKKERRGKKGKGALSDACVKVGGRGTRVLTV